ncbi:MAG: flagellar motor switch protein FliM, partial [Clostridiales bacterium]
MAEALSQTQIDELLSRMRSGNPEELVVQPKAKIKDYDFSSPKKLTKDQLKSLNNLYENFARILSSYFTSILRSVCEVTISQIEEQRYYEFNNALPDSALVGMVSFKPLAPQYDETTLMVDLPTTFGFLLIDRLMGGSEAVYAPDREYTEIELALLHFVLENIAKYMQEAWTNFFLLKTDLRSVETNGRLLQAYSQQDVVVIVTLDIKDE